jgi:hypothetical protein
VHLFAKLPISYAISSLYAKAPNPAAAAIISGQGIVLLIL